MAPQLSSTRSLAVLKTIAEALNGAADVDEALQTTLEQVAALLGLETGWIWLIDPRAGRFYGAAARRLPPSLREPVRMAGQACWCLRAFRAGRLTAGNIDVLECSRLRAAMTGGARAGTRGLLHHASIPLYFGSRPLGIMNVAAPAWRRLTRRELDLLSTIASQVGVAIERARLAGDHVHMARVQERARLARELHDTVAQGLTAIGLHLEAALDGLPPDAAARRPVARALELARSSLAEARRSIRQFRGADAPPLSAALSALAHGFAADTGIRVHVRPGADPPLPAVRQEELVRIAAEALANVRKHARGTDVEIRIDVRRARLRLAIADNGRGFDPRAPREGFGLVGMRERARALGGRLQVRTGRHGTTVTASLPLTDAGP